MLAKSSTAGKAPTRSRGTRGDGPGDRVLGRILESAGQAEHLVNVLTGSATTSSSVIRPVVTVPVLSRTTVSIVRVRLEHLGTLDQDAQLRAAAGADHQRRGRGQPECARDRR